MLNCVRGLGMPNKLRQFISKWCLTLVKLGSDGPITTILLVLSVILTALLLMANIYFWWDNMYPYVHSSLYVRALLQLLNLLGIFCVVPSFVLYIGSVKLFALGIWRLVKLILILVKKKDGASLRK
ncbi:MAG: hypothetical protein LBI30_04250 [Holosporales bacterium]|nr:hypothetical protein [Holosporales bacterium]